LVANFRKLGCGVVDDAYDDLELILTHPVIVPDERMNSFAGGLLRTSIRFLRFSAEQL